MCCNPTLQTAGSLALDSQPATRNNDDATSLIFSFTSFDVVISVEFHPSPPAPFLRCPWIYPGECRLEFPCVNLCSSDRFGQECKLEFTSRKDALEAQRKRLEACTRSASQGCNPREGAVLAVNLISHEA
jgi:hypothetical protein